jgi:rubrerythrin
MSDADRDAALHDMSLRLLRRRGKLPEVPRGEPAPWDADFFGLPAVRLFRDADARTRQAVVRSCGRHLVAESWHIEKCGIDFCARMVRLAASDETRRLYALIGADEAMHSAWLEPWLGEGTRAPDAFNRFIGGLVEAGTPQPLAYLLQVVLEGFGIVHYAQLAQASRDVRLEATLRRMAQDEGLHHAAGTQLFDAGRLTDAERCFLADGACAFVQMVRIGPQSVAAVLDRTIGFGGERDTARVFAELGTQAAAAAKLERLRRLMARPGMEWLVDQLERKGAFVPCRPSECARAYAEMR